ncbi:MAG: SpoIID/LytB domain-containing protein [Vulcanimicrobiota bacterium]
MKNLFFYLTFCIILISLKPAPALERPAEKLITIRIFSTRKLGSLRVSGENLHLIYRHKSVRINTADASMVPGTNKIQLQTSEKKRIFEGKILLDSPTPVKISLPDGNTRELTTPLYISNTAEQLILMQKTTIDNYLPGVISGEMHSAPMEALKAQAVAARSFVYSNPGRHKNQGYNFCDSTHCQNYHGNVPAHYPEYNNAARETRGEILARNGSPIPGYYHSTCGGSTTTPQLVFEGFEPFCKVVKDKIGNETLCRNSPHFSWSYKIEKKELADIFASEPSFISMGKLLKIRIIKKDDSGRILRIKLTGTNSAVTISGYQFWQILGSHLGWGTIKSAKFTIKEYNNYYTFKGYGLGHGIGLCQYGAMNMARKGFNYRDILNHYYPGTRIIRAY